MRDYYDIICVPNLSEPSQISLHLALNSKKILNDQLKQNRWLVSMESVKKQLLTHTTPIQSEKAIN